MQDCRISGGRVKRSVPDAGFCACQGGRGIIQVVGKMIEGGPLRFLNTVASTKHRQIVPHVGRDTMLGHDRIVQFVPLMTGKRRERGQSYSFRVLT